METNFENRVKALYEEANKIIDIFFITKHKAENKIYVPEAFNQEFFSIVDKVCLRLLEDKDNFYGYFLFQMAREISFNISSPTAVNFKGAKYVIYFNPVIFLKLNINQMEGTIKHEILHILSMHLIRAKGLKGHYSSLAINMAMDIVVNRYINNLPPYAVTLERINRKYSLNLELYKPFEYYVEKLQTAIDLFEDEAKPEDDSNKGENLETDFNPEKTHDLWKTSIDMDEKTLKEFTEKIINNSEKGYVPEYLEGMISMLKNSSSELPWNLYLTRLMGSVESNKKKTITRRNRRQPDRLDLRGELRSHKPKIAVALDISGSISDEEFKQAIKEVLNIVKNYNHEITIIESDDEIRRAYKVKSVKDIKDRPIKRGSTKYTPVFEYANKNKLDLLVYFTDGKGEAELRTVPKHYKVLWVISGRGDELSLKQPYGPVKKLGNIETEDNSLDIGMSEVVASGLLINSQGRI